VFLRLSGSFTNERVALRTHADGHSHPAIRGRDNGIQDRQALIVCKPVRFTHHAQYHNALASSVGGAINQAFKRHKIDFTVPIERGRQHKVDTIQTSVGGQFVLHVVSADTFMGINW
jgi:hypothetical protein|tara:strand:- start:1114 stop:1464 length:351 start_codon:yes stop_codon:yes gene_type:complete